MKVSDLQQDNKNANKGSAKGQKAIVGSLQRSKLGRSVLVDRHNRLIAGNKTTEAVAEVLGIDADVIVVESEGDKLIVHKRTDLDLDDPDPNNPARQLAYADNVTSFFSFELDPEVVMADLEAGFDFDEIDVSLEDLGDMMGGAVNELMAGNSWGEAFDKLPDEDRSPFQQMTFTLHDSQVEVVKEAISLAIQGNDFSNGPNQNSNGNGLAHICGKFINNGNS